MDNTNIALATNIQKFRKKCGLTQEELAGKLGVSFQAVSKWENAKTAPDILLLPVMADLFDCCIDELFSREVQKEAHHVNCPELPWADDSVIRGVVFEGRKVLQSTDLVDKFTFEIIGDAKNVRSSCSIEVNGNVSGGCLSNRNTVISGHLSGGANSGYSITVGGNVSGGCNSGTEISCGGNLSGDVNCAGTVKVDGDVEAKIIKGNVVCNSLKCDNIQGDIATDDNNQ